MDLLLFFARDWHVISVTELFIVYKFTRFIVTYKWPIYAQKGFTSLSIWQ